MIITFFVAGVPAPQGSTRAFVVNGKPIITHANRNTKDWRQRIATEAQKLAQPCIESAVDVTIEFLMPRPKSLPKRYTAHTKRPDLDKLVRAVLDGITGILIKDDSQVWMITALKRYAKPTESTGVCITIDSSGVDE